MKSFIMRKEYSYYLKTLTLEEKGIFLELIYMFFEYLTKPEFERPEFEPDAFYKFGKLDFDKNNILMFWDFNEDKLENFTDFVISVFKDMERDYKKYMNNILNAKKGGKK